MPTKPVNYNLTEVLEVDRERFPDSTTTPDQILAAIGPQLKGRKLSKRNRGEPHSPQNSYWGVQPQQTKAEYRAMLQEMVFGKQK